MTKTGSPNKKVLGTVAGLATVAALTMVFFTLSPMAPRLDRAPFRELGRRLGQAALQLQQPGSRIVLITRETTQFKTPAYEAIAAAFGQVVEKSTKPTLRILKVDPLRVVSVPPGEYVELFRKLDDRDIIVSLLGPPVLDDGQLSSIGSRRPRVVALCSGGLPRQVNLRRLFEEKLLHTAVVDEEGSGGSSKPAFKFVTAANLTELPAPSGAQP